MNDYFCPEPSLEPGPTPEERFSAGEDEEDARAQESDLREFDQ
jgi:hypothetical protein